MTEYTSSNRIVGTLIQIKDAIKQLQDWNKDVQTVDDYYCTPEGMKNLAASCMLIEAIGEGVKLIDRLTQSRLLIERPEIPTQGRLSVDRQPPLSRNFSNSKSTNVLNFICVQRNPCILHREFSTNHLFYFLLSQSDFVLSIV